ncbi:hypothetical protein AMS68_006451 [Peltaster fructicola]|uniref:Extracellular mutant protein 11 C-terminal domain-containing protein n=1 Tax=Peltaster fructicola TaxID=286661 RepID=A0A6H0Y1P9_9PEZI|nr:hypothetical protein AMS68_006451 [Peltaster fructicola]
MLAHVEKRNSRNDEARITAAEAEKLKIPLPAIGKEHKRQYRQPRRTTSKDSKITKAISQNANVDDNIADDIATPNVNVHALGAKTSWQTHAQPFGDNDLAEFEDIEDLFVYQTLDDQQIDAMKQRLAGGDGYKSTDKYIEGDSYPDTTSGRLTDVDVGDPPGDVSVPTIHDTVGMAVSRTRSAGKSVTRINQPIHTGQDREDAMPALTNTQAFFKRSDDVAAVAPSFQMSALRRDDNRKRPVTVQPQPLTKPQNRPNSQVHLYQQAKSLRDDTTDGDFARGARFREHKMPTRTEAPLLDNSNDYIDHTLQPDPTYGLYSADADQADTDTMQSDALDYDLHTLHKMEYKQLREESFDHDPHGKPFPDEDVTLSVKLNSLMALTPEEWTEFFYSLPIDEWEDAGDWFIDQYSSKLASLKHLRRQRRTMAQAFEVDVEQRQQAVVDKRIAIRNTMNSMRTHGAQVLITPIKQAS